MDYIRKYWHIIAGVACVVVFGAVYFWRDTSPFGATPERTVIAVAQNQNTVGPAPVDTETAQISDIIVHDIIVHIEGAVYEPGVFTLPYGSRVNDALELAGGATEEADLTRVNLAAFLKDAQQVIIPRYDEELIGSADSNAENPFAADSIPADSVPAGSGLVNINTATTSELQTLPGIGPVLAGNIIAQRDANGPFTTVEQLRDVPRIGAGILDNVRSMITVS